MGDIVGDAKAEELTRIAEINKLLKQELDKL